MSSTNYTIDDSLWYTPALSLSPGWNMLREESEEYISPSEVQIMRPLISGLFNSSYSWNTHAGCSNTITFAGSGITAYGLAGPNSGNFSVTIDGQTTMRSALSETTRYAHILFEVVGLDPKVNHSVTLTNMEDGKWFGFDYALVTTAVADAPPNVTSETEQTPSPPPMPFKLPEALTAPLQMLIPSQPSPEQLALLKPYHFHWTTGAYATISMVAIAMACAYVFFLFQMGGMLRDRAGGSTPAPLAGAAGSAKRTKRSSWSSRGSGRTRPTTRVMQALRTKKISGPSPIPEEFEEEGKKSPMTSESGEGSSTAGGSSERGTYGRQPRLSFAPVDYSSPTRVKDFV